MPEFRVRSLTVEERGLGYLGRNSTRWHGNMEWLCGMFLQEIWSFIDKFGRA